MSIGASQPSTSQLGAAQLGAAQPRGPHHPGSGRFGASRSTEEWEGDVGEQFRSLRLAAGLDQLGLASAAAVSVGAIRNLERGSGSTLRTVVRVTRVLGREDWLGALAPTPTVSPIDVLRSARSPRVRVYRPRADESAGASNSTPAAEEQ